ncbi:hypothetical protein KY084_04065 [Stakelama sp. CBK3Z-3]|uniref:Uncharacterized protein n=1 Tax=Stakelama flava TaxID=2860338 RepID=A0ABS6XIL7_9SPHN|nr:hypothetical protein [Stakelama flava]MBW4330048.1 hypothetical protein [Stakelama flava]
MRPDPHDYGPPNAGSFVVLRPVGLAYLVTVEPPLADGADRSGTYSDKDSGWGAARALWTDLRLPFRDETEGHFGNHNAKKFAEE